MRYKLFAILFILITVIGLLPCNAARDISMFVDGKKIVCDSPPIIENGRTLVPARALFEALDATLSWNDEFKQAEIKYDKTKILLTIGSKTAYVDGKAVTLDTAPVIKNSRTLMPVRFVAEKFGYDVEWDDVNSYIYITTPPEEDPKNEITDVAVKLSSSKMTLSVSFSEPVSSYDLFPLEGPARLVLDFEDCIYRTTSEIPVSKGGVKQVRMANHDETFRFVIDLEAHTSYNFELASNKLSAVLTVMLKQSAGNNTDNSTNTDKDNDKDNQTNNKPEATEPEEPKLPSDDGKLVVVLDAGHGGSDKGAIGYDDEGNPVLYENDINLDVSKKTAKYLRNKGITVLETRSTDVYVPLAGRTTFANDSNADIFVSIHTNSFTNGDANGSLTLYSESKDARYPNMLKSKDIAKTIQDRLYPAFGTRNSGIRSEDELYVLRHTTMPAVLIELAFISNEGDRKSLGSDEKRSDAAWAIACSIESILKQE